MGTTLVLLGRELPLPLGPQFLGGDWGACPGGCFKLSVCGLRCPRSPRAPQTSVCGKESQPPTQTERRGDCDHVWLCLAGCESDRLCRPCPLQPGSRSPRKMPVLGTSAPSPLSLWRLLPSCVLMETTFPREFLWFLGVQAGVGRGSGQDPQLCVFWGRGGGGLQGLLSPPHTACTRFTLIPQALCFKGLVLGLCDHPPHPLVGFPVQLGVERGRDSP